MKKFTLLFLTAAIVFCASAQKVTNSEQTIDVSNAKEGAKDDLPSFTSEESALTLINSITDAIGLKANFKLKVAKVPNVEAAIRHKQRYILYNPDFISLVNKAARDKWASIFILAHEIGHHLNGHTVMGVNSSPEIELEADEFAGFVLFRMGATLEEAQTGVQLIAGTKTSKTHPARADRMIAIQKGWNRAEQQVNTLAANGKRN